MNGQTFRALPALGVLALGLATASGALAQSSELTTVQGGHYRQTNLVSDGFIAAAHVDPQLVNPWGLAFNPFGFAWVSDADGTVSTLYDGNGVKQSLVVSIPTATADNGGNPTGIVYNGSSGFVVSKGTTSGPSRFLFATEQGLIAGWAPNVDVTHARVAVNRGNAGASYKGLALSANGGGQVLYAADFHNGRIDAFDANFTLLNLGSTAFKDPNMPAGFAPFGVQAINGDIYVTYAMQDEAKDEDVTGAGLGFVNVFNPNGKLLRRLASRGVLNAPWGIALAPPSFGAAKGALLVGNFGDGRINAFDYRTGRSLGPLTSATDAPLQIEGLWGLQFGSGFASQPVDTLFFTSGPDDEEHGLYGRIEPMP
jgi:uncharacterized protein (TIGR03118 family)